MRLIVAVLLIAWSVAASAQDRRGVSIYGTLPAICAYGESVVIPSGGSKGIYQCDQANNWTLISDLSGGAGGAAWGDITGTLSNQTDLQTALDGKQAAGSYATAAQGALADSALQPNGNGSSLTGLTKSQVGLGNVDNTADASKSVSSAATLTTPRTINGVSFNGSANITVTAAGSTLSDTVTVAKGGTNLTASADDNVMVGNGTTWQTKALPSCSNATTSKLLYDTATNAFSCGTDQTGAGGGDTVLVLAGDVSTGANTNLVDLTGMSFTADAGGIYKIEIWGDTQAAAATTGFGIGINCAQTPVHVALTGYSQLANTGTVTAWSAIANDAIVGVTSARPSTNTVTPTHGGGLLRAHASNAGTCTFRLRSETTAVVTMKANSTFIVRKVN